MKKRFIPRVFLLTAMIGVAGLNSNKFFEGELTEEQKKAAAEAHMKSIAKTVASEQMPALIEAGLGTEAAKGLITSIVNAVAKDLKIEDFDGTEKTVSSIIKEMQTQHDALVKAFEKKGGENKQGTFVEFVVKNIEDNKEVFLKDNKYFANLVIKAPALMTTANVIPNVAGGFSPLFGNYIDTEIGHVPKPENIMLPLITVKNQPGTESIWYSDRINEEGDAEFIGEGELKPLADAEWVTTKAPVKEVALFWKFTNRLAMHAPSVVSDFYEHAVELVDSKLDDGVLTGDNVGDNLNGLETIAAAFIVPPQLAGYYERVNIYDVIIAMATRIHLSNFKGQITAVLNTVWKAKMIGIKDAEGRYIMPEFVLPDGSKVLDVNVVFSNKIVDTAILIGELKRFNLVMAEDVRYFEGYENDDFRKNLMSKKLEAFAGTYIKRSAAGSILYDDIASVMEDIAVPEV